VAAQLAASQEAVSCMELGSAGCFKKSFTTLIAYVLYSKDLYSTLNCHNVPKHTEFYLG
jgi:hypothetical protein